jgi:hypothetical protein
MTVGLMGVSAASALAAPPTIVSESVSNIKAAEATLEGTVNPNGELTECHFQYGENFVIEHEVACTPELLKGSEPLSVGPMMLNEHGELVPAPITEGLEAGKTYKYRIVAKNGKGGEATKESTFTTAIPPATPETEKATAVEASTATLHGVLNPTGIEPAEVGTAEFFYKPSATECEITQGEREKGIPQLSVSAGSTTGKKEAAPAQDVTGLLPGTTYSVCLRALNGAGEPALGNVVSFTTIAVAPEISGESAGEVTATSAELNAEIDPGGGASTYHFEYDTTPYKEDEAGHGTSTPESASIGSDDTPHAAVAAIEGLEPGTTYHYRVVAHNTAGGGAGSTVDGPDATFTTQTGATGSALIDDRAWEQVSPVDKHGARIEAITKEGGAIAAAANGAAMTYVANGPTEAEPEGNPSLDYSQIISVRGAAGGWSAHDLATPHSGESSGIHAGQQDEYDAFSPNLEEGLVEPHDAPQLAANAKENTLFIRKHLLDGGAEPLYEALINDQNTPPETQYGNQDYQYIAASNNLQHVVFHSAVALTPNTGGGGLYEWTGGTLHAISLLPEGGGFVPETLAHIGYDNEVVRNAVSEDGELVFWETNAELFMREVGVERTVRLDVPQGSASPAGKPEAYFEYATPDGERVYFKDGQQLTSDSHASEGSPELYEYNFAKPPGKRLTDLTPMSSILGNVIGATNDGSMVYFASQGKLTSQPNGNGKAPEEGQINLYVAHVSVGGSELVSFVAQISIDDEHDFEFEPGANNEQNLAGLTARMSPDGNYLAFMSDERLTGYDNADAVNGAADEEVYEYNASTETVVCASCNPTGARPHGVFDPGTDDGPSGEGIGLLVDRPALWEGRWLAGSIPGWTARHLGQAEYQSRYLSDSGRLFFNSADDLVPQDTNGKEDAYEYEPRGVGACDGGASSGASVDQAGAAGCVGLISSGKSTKEVAFLDASESGNDVFFLTSQPLSPADTDNGYDVYDAHACSSESPCASGAASVSPPCTTEASCKAAPAQQPANFGAPASATFSGAGNLTPPVVKPTVRVSTRAQKLAAALKVCRKQAKRKRPACEATARKRYGSVRKAKGANRKGRK